MLYDDFRRSKIFSHNDNIDTYIDGIKYLIESKSDIVILWHTKNTRII